MVRRCSPPIIDLGCIAGRDLEQRKIIGYAFAKDAPRLQQAYRTF